MIVNLIFILSMNKLVDEYNDSYNHSIGKNPCDTEYSALTEELGMNSKAPNLKVGDTVWITKCKISFCKSYTTNLSEDLFSINSVLKTNDWTYIIKYTNGNKIIGNVHGLKY